MELWIISTIGVLAFVAYIVYGLFFLSKVWWAFGPYPKGTWKRFVYRARSWSVILFWPGWFIYIIFR